MNTVEITCYNPQTGQMETFTAAGASGGGAEPTRPNLMARRVNLSIVDVQQTIAEGRAMGITPIDLLGSGSGVGQGGQS